MLQRAKRHGRKPIIASGLPGDLAATIRILLAAGHSIGQVEFAEGGSFKITATADPHKPLAAASSDYLSLHDAEIYSGFKRSRFHELRAAGKFVVKQRGSQTVVSKSSIDRYLKLAPHRPSRASLRGR